MKKHIPYILFFLFQLPYIYSQNVIQIKSTIKNDTLICSKINFELSKQNINNTKSLKKTLFRKGYFDFNIKRIDTLKEQINYTLELNKKHKTLTLTTKAYKDLKIDSITTIKLNQTEDYLNQLSKRLTNKGYVFDEVQLKNIKTDEYLNLTADLVVINKETKRYINKITLKGYKKLPKVYVSKYLNIKKNQVLNLEELKKKTKSINNLGFVEEIKSPEILFTKDSTEVFIYIKKKNANSFDGILGFTNEEGSDKIKLNGYLNLKLTNNLNSGESLILNYKNDEGSQKNFNATLKLPYLFNSSFGFETSLNIFTRDSVFTNSSFSIKPNYQLNQKTGFSIGYENNTSASLEELNTTIEDYDSKFTTIGALYHKKNNDDFFRDNFLVDLQLKTGSRKTESKNLKQNIINLKLVKHLFINKKHIIRGQYLFQKLYSEDILTNELFRFGGINTIRGFNENSIEADFNTIVNIEYHYRLNNTISINTITDIGYFENKITNTNKQLYAIGTGLKAKTRAGIVQLIFANGTTKGTKLQFRNTNLHLNLTAKF